MNCRVNIVEIGSFALPVLIERTSIAVMSVVGTMLIANVGTDSVSGVSLVESLNNLLQQIFLSLEVGVTVVIAQYCGRKDYQSASEACLCAMFTALAIALVLCIVLMIFPDFALGILGKTDPLVYKAGRNYFKVATLSLPFLAIYQITAASLRGSGNPRLSLISVIVTDFSFVVTGVILLKVFKMGVEGIGISLITARFFGACTGLYLLKYKSEHLRIKRWIPKKFNWQIQRSILFIGIPSAIENIIFTAGRLATQTYTISMGTSAIATNAIANSISAFYNIPGETAAAISIPIVGKYLGMKDSQNAKDSSKTILILSAVSYAILSVLLFILAYPVASLFTSDSEIIQIIVRISRLNFLVTPIIWTFSFVIPAFLRASGDIKYTTIVSILSMLLFRITIGYLLSITLRLGVIGIWIGMFADWFIRSILFGIRYFQGKWSQRTLFHDNEIEIE